MPVRVDRTEQIEKALANVYLALFKEIKKDEQWPANVTFLKSKYNRKVYDASRKAISQVYAEGAGYVGRILGVETYQSDRDTAQIKQDTDRAVQTFWVRLGADAQRAYEISQQQSRIVTVEEKKKEEFDTQFYLQNAAMIATTGALAISTLSKTNQIVSDPELKADNPELADKPKIRWVAQMDEKTCKVLPNGNPGCWFLNDQVWDYDDPEIPVPGRLGENGTHPNCHCYLSLE